MAGIAEASPFIACGPDYANAGHLSLPFPPADLEGTLTQKWSNMYQGSEGPEHSNVFLPSLPWQPAEWDISEGFLPFPESSLNRPPAESVSSGSEGSLASVWDYQNDQVSQGREYSPSAISSATSDHPMPASSSLSSLSLHSSKEPPACKKPARPRKSTSEESAVSKRPRRTKTVKEQEASRARIREKNRVAADKCRGRQRIAVEKLSTKHGILEDQNRQLTQMMKDLVAERIVLKNMLLEHGSCGCELIENYLRDSAVRWVKQVESQAVNVEAA